MEYAPTEEVLKWYEDKLRDDPEFNCVLDNWEHLPFPPQFEDPELYVPFISRQAWGALPAKEGATPLPSPVKYVRWTWTGKEECYSVEECSRLARLLQKRGMEEEGLPDIRYNFMVGSNGIIYEGRGWEWEADREERHDNFEGLHGKLKGQTMDIAYMGDMSFYGPMNDVMMGGFNFIQQSVLDGHIDKMFEPIPYRERPTDYGDPNVYFNENNVPDKVREQLLESKRRAEELEREHGVPPPEQTTET